MDSVIYGVISSIIFMCLSLIMISFDTKLMYFRFFPVIEVLVCTTEYIFMYMLKNFVLYTLSKYGRGTYTEVESTKKSLIKLINISYALSSIVIFFTLRDIIGMNKVGLSISYGLKDFNIKQTEFLSHIRILFLNIIPIVYFVLGFLIFIKLKISDDLLGDTINSIQDYIDLLKINIIFRIIYLFMIISPILFLFL